jgi:hypothetical protein
MCHCLKSCRHSTNRTTQTHSGISVSFPNKEGTTPAHKAETASVQNQSSLGHHTKLEFTYASFLFFSPGSGLASGAVGRRKSPGRHIRSERRRTRRGVRPHLRLATFPAEEPVHSLKNTGTTNKTFCRTKEKTHQSYNLSIGAMFFRVHVLRCMYAPPPPPRTWKTQMLRSDSSTNNAKPMKYII